MQLASRLAGCLLAGSLAATAVLAADEPASAPQVARDSAPIVVANRRILVLRGVAGYSARERVAASLERIERALAAENRPAVTTEETVEGTRMMLGGAHAFFVTRADIDVEAGETTQIVARVAKERLELAIGELREQQAPRFIAEAAALAVAATLLFGVALWLIVRANRWVRWRLSRSAAAHSEKLRVGGLRILDAAYVVVFTRRLFTALAWMVALLLASAWLSFVLERFPYTRPWGEQLSGHLLGIIGEVALAIVRAMPGLLLAVLIFLIARGIVRVIAIFFEQVVRGDRKVGWIDGDTARPTRRILSFIIWVFALAIAYPYLPGAQTEAFKGLSVLLGLMVSLGATSVIGQAFNGLILMYSRAYRAGDYVRIGDSEGTVELLGTFVTRIRTGLGEELILPNSTVMTGSIKNYSRAAPGGGCVLDTAVTIGYSTPWRQVHAMLEEAARRTTAITREPAPYVRQTALSDYYVEYRLVASTSLSEPVLRAEALSRLHANIQDVFNEYGVQILSPHYMIDPKEPHIVPKDRWYEPPAKAPEKP